MTQLRGGIVSFNVADSFGKMNIQFTKRSVKKNHDFVVQDRRVIIRH